MYNTIQKRIAIIFCFIFILVAVSLYFLFSFLSAQAGYGMMVIILCFLIVILVTHMILGFIQKHLETYTIYRLVRKKQIALCKIKKASYYKTRKDFYFKSHNVYAFDLEVYNQDNKAEEITIYEDVDSTDFSCLPAYAYVTYHKNLIGFIPTFFIYVTPQLKDIVKNYENTYHPHYIEVTKKKGLCLHPFTKTKKDK